MPARPDADQAPPQSACALSPTDFRQSGLIGAGVLIVIALLYWPVVHGDFVWDDVVNFRRNTWLTDGDQWKHYIFRDFNYWKYYFRPLVVGFFTIQLRLFDGAPGPMHVVSLAIHLANTTLVGLLALRCAAVAAREPASRSLPMAVSMALFGLHPAVIEAVAWVGCQYDLLLTLFTLLGLLANTCIRSSFRRALVVALFFFLAACSKEAAATFPLVLVLFDWALQANRMHGSKRPPALKDFILRNAATWIAVFAAGLAYLAFRHLAMGPSLMPRPDSALTLMGHVQMICFTYMKYWAMLFTPTAGMAPVHEYAALRFVHVTPSSILMIATSIGVVGIATYLALRRASALACMALILTATLIPVLRIFPAAFNPNLYHDRYLVCGLAVICAMVPLLRPRLPESLHKRVSARLIRLVAAVAALAWAASSAMTIRSTVPLWANETTLWTWAYATNRNSVYAISNLLELHLVAGRAVEARGLADRVMDERISCPNCLLNIGALALHDRDSNRATTVLRILELNERLYWSNRERYRRVSADLRSFVLETRHGNDAILPNAAPPDG